MEHLKNTGTLIAVLHKPESLDTAEILHTFSSFSDITLFKPDKAHAKRSSFYMVAKNVQSHSLAAVEAVKRGKRSGGSRHWGQMMSMHSQLIGLVRK
jgi:hypothetical protein